MDVPFVLTACILLAVFSSLCQCCGLAEIGQQYTIISTATVPVSVIVTWQLGDQVILYDSTHSNSSKYPNLYVGARTQLTINNVTKKDTTEVFSHIVNGLSVYNCTLTFFKRPNIPTCKPVTLTGNQIRTTCTTGQVYPQAKCQYTVQNKGTDRRDIDDATTYITYTHTDPQPGGNEYYTTSCTLQYPVDGLKPGNWTVQVNMYPGLTGLSLANSTVGQAVNPVQLSVPTVTIDRQNCPIGLPGEGNTNVRDGYIRKEGRASCLCTRSHAGNPPGSIDWTSTKKGNYEILSKTEAEAMIRVDSLDYFTCYSISVLNGSHSATYEPSYAYGPSSASLIFQPSGPIYLCPNQQTNMDIKCQVPANSFNPRLKFTILDDYNNGLVTKVDGDTAWFKSVSYNFTKSGQHTFKCHMENAVFSDIFIETPASAVQIYAPPNSPPSFQVKGPSLVTDNSETWVKQGSHINVSCSVGTAYPLVTSVIVTCGQVTSSSGQREVVVSSINGDKLVCHCSVDHETKDLCNGLNLNKTMDIHTAYGPNELTISLADSQLGEKPIEPLNLCSSEGLDLTVICSVKVSGVRPDLTNSSFTLTKSNAFTNTQQQYLNTSGTEFKSVNKLKVTKGGKHTLVCEARNPKFSDIKQTQSVTIQVREPPSDPPKISALSSQSNDILVVGDNVTVTCDVLKGIPFVDSVTLTCGQEQTVTKNGTSAILTLSDIGLEYNETNCTCEATHVTRCYNLMGVLPLTILMSNQTQFEQEDSPPIGAAVGGAIGAFVVIAVVVGGIFYIRRRMKKKEQPCPEEGGYDPHKDKTAVFTKNDLYGTAPRGEQVSVPAKDYTTVKATMKSATAPPKKYIPENVDRPIEDVNPVVMDRKSLFKKSQTKPTPGAKPKIPKTSVKTDAVPKPGEQAQNNTESEYATVAKTKPSHSKSSDHDQTDDLTTAGATGGMPVVPDRLKDSVNQQSASKGKQKKTKDKSAKKEKKKDKKEKGKDTDDDHIYSNETFDRRGDVDVYANITMGMKSTNDVDDGMHKNKDGLVYTTIVGVGSLKGGQRPVHHPRNEAPVDYADIDFNKIVANREDQD